MFIGRKAELQFLKSKYEADAGQLVVLYGRRRIGKTETLLEFCKGKEFIYYACTEQADAVQLKMFSQSVLQKGHPAAKYLQKFPSWREAFAGLEDLSGNSKKLIVIDEFPYMVKGNPEIPSVLQNLWDTKLRHLNVMIILCGSSMSFIEKEILGEKNPLYGRTTGILKMLPMNFYEASQFFPNYSTEDKIKAYAIVGGIPHYLKQFDANIPLGQNIIRQMLTRGSILYSEVEFLLRQELREPGNYNTIIQAIALGNTQLNDIYQKTQIEKTKLSAYLGNLMELGIVYREFSVEAPVKEQANTQRGLYQLTDSYFRFWYRYVFPYLSELEAGDAEAIWQYAVEPDLDFYTSYAFEDVCRQYLRKLNQEGRLPFHFTKIGRWWNKTDELDIMALDTAKQNLLLGECKFKKSMMEKKDFEAMKQKLNVGKDIRTYYWLFSKSGFSRALEAVAKEEGVALVSLNEMA